MKHQLDATLCRLISAESLRNKTCTVLHQVGVSFDLYYDPRKHKIKIIIMIIYVVTQQPNDQLQSERQKMTMMMMMMMTTTMTTTTTLIITILLNSRNFRITQILHRNVDGCPLCEFSRNLLPSD